MAFAYDELLPLSGLQHIAYCERQAALMYVEQQWVDNVFTAEGSLRHRRVHDEAPRRERRGDLLITRGLPLRSRRLGVSGIADVVEFHREAEGTGSGVRIPGLSGFWRPYPIEYKRGRPKVHRADEVQLCAQALCLEEMLGVEVPEGAIYYGRQQRRWTVVIDEGLRALTAEMARRYHELVRSGTTPPAEKGPRCRGCSLIGLCMPESMSRGRSATRYLMRELDRILREEV